MCIVKGTAEGELLLEKNIMFPNFKYDQTKAESEDSAFMHFDSDTENSSDIETRCEVKFVSNFSTQ